MPIHDWSRVPAGLFHDFHQHWSIEIAASLNRGRLPKGIAALVEQRSGPRESHVLAIESRACYVEPVGVGDAIPDMPLFLANSWHVPVPLESTYEATWTACPEELQLAVETGVMPEPDAE